MCIIYELIIHVHNFILYQCSIMGIYCHRITICTYISIPTKFSFCYACIQKQIGCRQFASLSTINKVLVWKFNALEALDYWISYVQIIDAGLVNSLFSAPDIAFHSSRLLNRSHFCEVWIWTSFNFEFITYISNLNEIKV